MPRERSPYPLEDAPNYNPDDPYADKAALADHRQYLLGQYFIKVGRARVCSLHRSGEVWAKYGRSTLGHSFHWVICAGLASKGERVLCDPRCQPHNGVQIYC
jgi:hypothetical protein